MSTTAMLTDAQWARIEPLLPPLKGSMGKPFLPHRPVVEGCIYRLKGGDPVADAAARVRYLADGAPPSLALVAGRHLGPDPDRAAGAG